MTKLNRNLETLRLGPPPDIAARPPKGKQTEEERHRWIDHPGYGMLPQRVVSILRQADYGYPQRQCDLFDDGIELDAHLRSQLETRRHAVAGKEWLVQPGGDAPEDRRAAELLEEALRRAPSFASMIVHQLTAPWYGWAATEMTWDRVGGVYAPAFFLNVPHRRFIFDEQDEPLLVGGDGWGTKESGRALTPGSWIFGRMPGRLIAASGLMRTAIRISFAKRLCMRDWTEAGARFGIPLPVGFYPLDYPEKEQDKLLEMLAMIGKRGYAAIGEGARVEFMKADLGSGATVWPNLASFCNAEISKLVTGATLTSGEGSSTGSYALGAVHENVAYQIVKSDAKWLGDLFERDVGRPFLRFNGIDARPPLLKFHMVLLEDPKARAEVMKQYLELGGQLDEDQVQQELQFKPVTGRALRGGNRIDILSKVANDLGVELNAKQVRDEIGLDEAGDEPLTGGKLAVAKALGGARPGEPDPEGEETEEEPEAEPAE
jgi:phage gp29-like protein